MQITRQADYAVRAILHLAQVKNGVQISTSTIAKEQGIPPSFLAKIISQLSITGLLHTLRGAHGGVTLARDPKDITLSKSLKPSTVPFNSTNVLGIMESARLILIAHFGRSGAMPRRSWLRAYGKPTLHNC